MSSESCGFRAFRGARPGEGYMHSMWALEQLVQIGFLSHFTLRRRHVTHDRGFRLELPFSICWAIDVGFCTLFSDERMLGDCEIE